MSVLRNLVSFTAAAALISGLSIVSVQAAPALGKVAASSQLQMVAEKAKKPAAKKAGAGRCGVMKYWDKKTKTCADATKKKS